MSTADVVIRKFNLEDYDALVGLWKEVGLPYKPNGRDAREKIAAEYLQPTARFLVAELNGSVVGAVLGTHDGRKGWINRIVVAKACQGRGIGEQLLHAAEQQLEAAGIEIIACLIDDLNENSKAFFARFGYIFHDDIHYFCKRKYADV